MIAAIYVRKSTDEGDRNDDAKSVAVQIADARAYVAGEGWTVDDRYIFSDDGVSGAAFTRAQRPEFFRLLDTLSPRPPFGALVVTEQSRIGRDTFRTLHAIQQFHDAGVRVFESRKRREIKLEEDSDEVQEFMGAWSSSQERRKARERTRPVLRAKARDGYVAGGRVYGYTNVREGSNSVRRVNEAEAAVVRRMFELTAQGHGLLKIAKRLNAEDVPSPRGDGWATTAIREMLRRDLYRGRVVYGKTTWQWRAGRKFKVRTPESEWLVRGEPALRIVPEDLWQAAHARLARTRETHTGRRRPNGQLDGRPESGLLSNHLLSGFLRCGLCGGNMFVAPRSGKRGEPQLYYVCTTHHKRGNTRCTNRWGVPYHDLTDAVLTALKERLLRPDVIERVVTASLAEQAQAPDEQRAQKTAISARMTALDREIANYTRAVGQADGEVRPLVEALQARQRERTDLSAKLEHLDGLTKAVETWDADRFRQFITPLVKNLEVTLYHPAVPQEARGVIRTLVTSPIKVTPHQEEKGVVWFEYTMQLAYDQVLTGALGAGPGAATKAQPGDGAGSVTKPNATKLVPPG